MNENEQSFESLRQLLKLKQHEVPPPGYFGGFSRQVISAIQAEQKEPATSTVGFAASWFNRFLSSFDSRPGLVGGLATSMVLFLVLGIVMADHSDNELVPGYTADAVMPANSPVAVASLSSEMPGNDQASSGGITVSTNPVTSLQPASALFGQDNPLFQTASYVPAGSGGH